MSDHTERIIRFDEGRGEGVRVSLAAADRFFDRHARAVAATRLAWMNPDRVVHFWDPSGLKHFVAHDEDELVGAPRDHFESRSLPISAILGHASLVGDGEADAAPEIFRFAVHAQTCLPVSATTFVEAASEEEAIAMVRHNLVNLSEALNTEAIERASDELNAWDGFEPEDIHEAECID